jgi:PAS domain-containing protein
MTSSDSIDKPIPRQAVGADDATSELSDAAILRARIRALLRRCSFLDHSRGLMARAKEKEIEKLHASAELKAAEAGATLSKQLLCAHQELDAANAKLKEVQAHLIETERLASIAFRDTLALIDLRGQERKSAEETLRESEERYALAAQGANDGCGIGNSSQMKFTFRRDGTRFSGFRKTVACPIQKSGWGEFMLEIRHVCEPR